MKAKIEGQEKESKKRKKNTVIVIFSKIIHNILNFQFNGKKIFLNNFKRIS